MAYGGGYGYGRGYRWRNMYYLTGLPGWMRFGYSPGWGGMPPGAQYLGQTSQVPQFTWQAPSATHSACAHFVPPNRCSLKDIEVDPMGEACKDFSPQSLGFPAMTKEREIQMLESQARMIEQEIEEIKKRLENLRR
ncbi:MAG: DUF5320 domain-containing protein [Candidatus Syntropharchaeia archaeon]